MTGIHSAEIDRVSRRGFMYRCLQSVVAAAALTYAPGALRRPDTTPPRWVIIHNPSDKDVLTKHLGQHAAIYWESNRLYPGDWYVMPLLTWNQHARPSPRQPNRRSNP